MVAFYKFLEVYYPQRAFDCLGMAKGLTNAFIAFPLVGYSCYEYMTQLKGLEYNSEAYVQKRKEIHVRVADRIHYMSNKCGGIYFKGGQYLGTLERIIPKEYTDKLKDLQEKGSELPFDQIKVTYEHDLDKKLEEVFKEFDKKPVASASIA